MERFAVLRYIPWYKLCIRRCVEVRMFARTRWSAQRMYVAYATAFAFALRRFIATKAYRGAAVCPAYGVRRL